MPILGRGFRPNASISSQSLSAPSQRRRIDLAAFFMNFRFVAKTAAAVKLEQGLPC